MNEYRETSDPYAESPEPPYEYDFWDEPLAGLLGLSHEDPPDREILIAETILRDEVSIRFPYEQGDWDPEWEVSHVLVRHLDDDGRPSRLVESWAQALTVPACMLARTGDPHVRSLMRLEDPASLPPDVLDPEMGYGITYPVVHELIRIVFGDSEAAGLLDVRGSVGFPEIWQAFFGSYGELLLVQRTCLGLGDSIRNPRHLRWEWEARRKGFLVPNPFQQESGADLPRLDRRPEP